MVPVMYKGVAQMLWPAAGRSVESHLIDLERRGLVAREGRQGRLDAALGRFPVRHDQPVLRKSPKMDEPNRAVTPVFLRHPAIACGGPAPG